jgi:hypothetical protein
LLAPPPPRQNQDVSLISTDSDADVELSALIWDPQHMQHGSTCLLIAVSGLPFLAVHSSGQKANQQTCLPNAASTS